MEKNNPAKQNLNSELSEMNNRMADLKKYEPLRKALKKLEKQHVPDMKEIERENELLKEKEESFRKKFSRKKRKK